MPEPSTDKPLPLPPGISVVVPVYNSEATLSDLVARLEPVLATTASQGNFEAILVKMVATTGAGTSSVGSSPRVHGSAASR